MTRFLIKEFLGGLTISLGLAFSGTCRKTLAREKIDIRWCLFTYVYQSLIFSGSYKSVWIRFVFITLLSWQVTIVHLINEFSPSNLKPPPYLAPDGVILIFVFCPFLTVIVNTFFSNTNKTWSWNLVVSLWVQCCIMLFFKENLCHTWITRVSL